MKLNYHISPDFDDRPLRPLAPPCSSLLPHVHTPLLLLLEAQWSGWSSKDQSSLPWQDQNHYSLMVIAPTSFAVPTCHWACSTPNRAEGSPRRSDNSDGKVRFTFARRAIFVSKSLARFDFWLYFCQVRLPPEPGSDGVSPPVCATVFCLHAGIIRYHCWIALFLMDLISGAVHAGGSQEPRDVEGSHGDRERHPAEDWQVCHHYHHHDIILRTIITNHHKCKMPSSFIIVFSSFSFASLWFSGLGSGLSLVISSKRGFIFTNIFIFNDVMMHSPGHRPIHCLQNPAWTWHDPCTKVGGFIKWT